MCAAKIQRGCLDFRLAASSISRLPWRSRESFSFGRAAAKRST
jgi:hypothetical protein